MNVDESLNVKPLNTSRPSLKRFFSWAPVAAIAIIPTLVFYAAGARSIEPINGQDGYAYIGVVSRTQDFLSRFPDSYFGTRFGYVVPSDFFAWMFGFEIGHHFLRFALLAVAVLLMRVRAKILFPYAVVSAVLFSLSPIVLVSTYSTYTMSVGALVLLFGVLVLAIYGDSSKSQFLVPVLSAALFAVAWNSHLQLLLPAVLLYGVLTIDHLVQSGENRFEFLVKCGLAGLVGTSIICLLGVVVLGYRYGVWNPWAPALRFAASTPDEAFKSSGLSWLTWRQYVFLIPLSLFASTAVWLTEKDPLIRQVNRRLSLSTFVLLSVYSYYQWGLKGIAFETFYHSSGLFVVSVATLLVAVTSLANRIQMSSYSIVLLIFSGVAAYFVGSRFTGNFLILLFLATVTAVLFVIAVFCLEQIQPLLLVAIVVVSSWVTVSSPHDFPATAGGYRTDPLYDEALFSYDTTSMNRASALNRLSLMIPSDPEVTGDIRIWFDPQSKYDQLSAPWLWYRSALQAPSDSAPPVVTDTVRDNVLIQKPNIIVIVDGDKSKVTEGAKAITEIASYRLLWIKQIKEGNFTAYVSLLGRNR